MSQSYSGAPALTGDRIATQFVAVDESLPGTSRHFLAPRVLNAIGAIADVVQAAPIKLGARPQLAASVATSAHDATARRDVDASRASTISKETTAVLTAASHVLPSPISGKQKQA